MDKSKAEDVPDVVRPASKPSSQGMVSGFSLQNNQNMRYTFKGALSNTGLHIPCQSEFLKRNSNNDLTQFYDLHIYSNYKRRYETFSSWPKSHPIRAEYLCRAGFLYTGQGDKVLCPWCKLMLIEWEIYDLPMEEHQRHSPHCPFLNMIMPSPVS